METQPAAYFDQRVIQEMGTHLHAPAWSVKQKLALTCQMLAAEGHESGLAGQISARAEPPGSFWTLRFGLGFDEATENTRIRVDDDLGTLEGEGIPILRRASMCGSTGPVRTSTALSTPTQHTSLRYPW